MHIYESMNRQTMVGSQRDRTTRRRTETIGQPNLVDKDFTRSPNLVGIIYPALTKHLVTVTSFSMQEGSPGRI